MVIFTEISQEYESQSAASSSSSSSTYSYDVFLSFIGADTGYGFTSNLHKALLKANIQTFLDDAETQTGEDLKPQLEGAIKSSRASIIVLSKNYAFSTWCLDELLLILEQQKNFNQIVIPVFYHVGTFGDAMEKHKQRTNAEKKSQRVRKIEKWEEALTAVANIKWTVPYGRLETTLIEGIVKEISRRFDLPRWGMLHKVIGMESLRRTIASFLKDESSEAAESLALWGTPGNGKTYLTWYMFRLHNLDFERSCFLEDIERRCESPNGLLDLQKQLLKDIRYGRWTDITNTSVGTYMISESLMRKKTLLVLDNVSKVEQLGMLIGTKGLHPKSKIIITSKNGSLTEKWLFQTQAPLKHTKQAVEGLNKKESLELLSLHAFGRIDHEECKKEEPKEVVAYCQGHPLALKVLGSYIHKTNATWADILESLGKEVNPYIGKALQISIDSLKHSKQVLETQPIVTMTALASEKLCHSYSLADIQLATQNFDDRLVVGEGGFGKVYKGCMKIENNISTLVAIKRLDSVSSQGAPGFRVEVEMLSRLRHCQLVSLLGFCVDGKEMILVYEYMTQGSLHRHLHTSGTPLSWTQRLKISIRAARGLDYLHTGAGTKHGVIHRDVKSSNILLDDDLAAKISDFGLAKLCPTNLLSTNVHTRIKGTFGYLDPETFETGTFTRRTDVYAFGVVLFELLSRRNAVLPDGDENLSLARWAKKCVKKGDIDQVVATELKGTLSPKSLKQFALVAYRCLHSDPKERPTMSEHWKIFPYTDLEHAKRNSQNQRHWVLNFWEARSLCDEDTTCEDILEILVGEHSASGNTGVK